MIAYLGIFLLNLFIELVVAGIIGYRQIKELLSVVAVNMLTHPVLTVLVMWLASIGLYNFWLLIVMEIVVVLIEWQVLQFALRKRDKALLLLAFVMNAVSFGIGLLL